MGNPAPAPATTPLKYQSIEDQLQDPQTQLLLARVLYGEAGGNADDMRAVLGTVINRARQSGQSIHDVLLSQGQFTSIGPLPGAEGGRRDELEGMGSGALTPEYSVIQQALDPKKGFDPATGVLQGFNPGINKFFAPKAQEQYHAKYPNIYPEKPSFAVGDPAYSAGGQNFYVGAPYHGGFKIMGDLAAPTSSSTVNQAIAAQDPNDLSQFELPPEQQAIIRQNQAAAHALLPEQLANIDAQAPIIDEEIQGLQSWQDSANAAQARYDKTMSSVIDSLPDEHKMQMEALRDVSPDHPGDPHRALTQFLPMLVMLGGMFARGGGIGAMEASAAAVNAARAHDDQALDRAHQQFQDNLTEAVDKASMAHEELGEAIASSKGNQALLVQKADLLATKLGFPALKIAALNGDTNAILTAFANQSRAIAQAASWSKTQSYIALNQAKIAQLTQQIGAGQNVDDEGLWLLAKAAVYDPNVKPPPFTRNQDQMRMKYIQYQTYAAAGLTPPDIVDDPSGIANIAGARSTITADQQALNQNTKNLAGLRSFVQSFDSITTLAEKAVGPGTADLWGPMWNAPIREALKQTGNPNVPLLNTFLYSMGLEYGKITGGSYGSVRPVSDAQEAKISDDILSGNMTVNQIYTVIQGMRQEADARINGIETTNAELEQDIKSEASTPAQPTPTPTTAPTAQPAPATPAPAAPAGPVAPVVKPILAKDFNRGTFESELKYAGSPEAKKKGWTPDSARAFFHAEYPWMDPKQIDVDLKRQGT